VEDEQAPDADLDGEAVLELARQAKALLRKRARGLRSSIPKAAIAARSEAIVQRLLASPWFARAEQIALFHPIAGKNEVDLRALDPVLRARGARVYYPWIDPETKEMTFRDPGDASAMVPGRFGFFEPDADRPEATTLDIVVVPALLVDDRGQRLGYGAGYYDRTLPRFCPPGRSAIVAFDFQLAADLPTTPGDVPCDVVLTDARTVKPLAAEGAG